MPSVLSKPPDLGAKITFNSIFCQAWYKSVMPANITSGFRKAGVFPVDHDAVKVIMLIIQVNVTMMTMVVVKIIQVHAPQTSLSQLFGI